MISHLHHTPATKMFALATLDNRISLAGPLLPRTLSLFIYFVIQFWFNITHQPWIRNLNYPTEICENTNTGIQILCYSVLTRFSWFPCISVTL